MNSYKVTDIKGVTINSGNVALSFEQALRRRYGVKIQPDGTYNVTAPIQFKAGEVFGYNGTIPKGMAECLTPTESEPEAKKVGRPKKI